MSTHKKIDLICIAAVLFTIGLTILLMSSRTLEAMAAVSEGNEADLFTADDLNADWNLSSATKITLSDNGSTIKGNGAYAYNKNIYIVYAGHYVLSGELTDGSIIIDAEKSDKIWILLDGVSLHCDDDAAIRVERADKVFLTLADGSSSTISSGTQYSSETIASGVDGTIYSRDDLTINGNGELTVNAVYHHGIVCNDNLTITGGNISINAVQDGIHANDSVRIRDAVISVYAGDDGITVSNDDETAFLYIASGSITIPDCYEGLEAINITIAGGTIDICPTDDGINANGNDNSSVIRITGGDIRIVNPSGRDADGLDSNGSIYIEGGKVFISVTDNGGNCAIDYGSENGGKCVVSGGTVIACGNSAMVEGFDADSPQGFLMYNTAAAAGTTIALKDSLGQELFSEEIPCGFSSVVLSMPELKIGDTCTIEIDGVQEQVTITNTSLSGFWPAGMFGGGMHNGGNHDGMPNHQGNRDNPFPYDREDNMRPGDLPQNMPPQENGQNFSDKQGMEDNKYPGDLPPNTPPQRNNQNFSDKQGIKDFDRMDTPDEDNWPALLLAGISLLVLLAGLYIAMKTNH